MQLWKLKLTKLLIPYVNKQITHIQLPQYLVPLTSHPGVRLVLLTSPTDPLPYKNSFLLFPQSLYNKECEEFEMTLLYASKQKSVGTETESKNNLEDTPLAF